jgi:aquaporin NIP
MKLKHQLSQYIAEFIGTFFLVFFGCGIVVLSQVLPGTVDSVTVPLVWGGVVSIMIYAVGHISGAHFNPAVTIAFWAVKRFPTFRLPGYIIAQVLGAIAASLCHKFIWGAPHNFGAPTLSMGFSVGLFVEMLLGFVLMFVIISVATDSRAVGELAGIAIGTTVMVCAAVAGPITGASINPARYLGPALLNGNLNDFLIYTLATIVGAVLAALTYEWIRCHKESESDHGCC